MADAAPDLGDFFNAPAPAAAPVRPGAKVPNPPYVPAYQQLTPGEAQPDLGDFFNAPAQPDIIQRADLAIKAGTDRVMNAFGYGAKEAFGSQPIETPATALSPETESFLKKAGIFNDYSKGHADFAKASLEGIIRSAAAGFDLANRAVSAVMAAPLQAAGQAIEETGLAPRGALTGTEGLAGAATDPGVMMALGLHAEVPENLGIGAKMALGIGTHVDLAKARSLGVIGEGEAGWKGTVEPTAPTLQERAAATKEVIQSQEEQPLAAGKTAEPGVVQAPEPVTPQASDIHAIARQIAPDTFQKYDALQARQDTFRSWISDLAQSREADPKITAAQDAMQTILGKVNGVEDRLTNKQSARLDDLRDQVTDFLRTDTPDMARVREELVKNDYQLRDLAPDVSAAYRQAQERLPAENVSRETSSETNTAPTEIGAGPVSTERPTETPAPAQSGTTAPTQEQGNIEPSIKAIPGEVVNPSDVKSPTPLGANDNPIKSIADDVSKKLVAAGRPQEEADAAAQIVQAHYEARSQRFNGTKGSPEDLYGREGADIKGAEVGGRKGAAAGKTAIREARSTITLFSKADASTFMHETGHDWLNELMRDAEEESAPQSLKDDAASVRKWAGAPEEGEIPTRGHEKFARGFERYLMEGRAPTQGLADVFGKFKGWLTKIYGVVTKLRAPITDDIRNVFDRLLTSNPEKPVIAADREPGKSLADIHEADAESTPPERSREVAANIRQEIDKTVQEKAPELGDELGSNGTGRTGGIPAEDAGAPSGGNAPGPGPGENGTAPQPRAVPTRGNEAPQESGGTRTIERSEPQPTAANGKYAEPEGKFIDKAGNIRLDNLNAGEDVNDTLREWADKNNGFLAARRGVVSDAEVLDYAEAQGLSTSDVNLAKLRAMSVEDGVPLAARILGGRQMLVDSANAVHAAMAGDDPIVYATVASRHLMIQESLSAITAEIGRGLRAFRMMGQGTEAAENLSEFLKENIGRDLFQIKKEMAAGKLLDSPGKVSGFLRDARKPSGGEMVLEAFKNWLISGPHTHMMYAVGNKVFALYKAVPETAARAAVGAIHEVISGPQAERVYFGEVPANLYAMFYGQRDGLRAAYDSFKAGRTVELPGEEAAAQTQFNQTKAIPNPTILGVKFPLGSAIRAPGERMVAPLHAYDRAVGYETIKAGLIYRKAASEGLIGDAFNSRIADLSVHTPDDIMAAARDETTEQALMGRTGKFTQNFSRWIRSEIELPLLGRTQPLSFIEPFINIASVINKQALIDRSPIGLISKSVRDDLAGRNGSLAQDTAIAKMSLGTSFAAMAAGLVMEGSLNRSAPTNRDEADVSLRVNGLPHSIKIGEMSYQLNRLGVPGMQLSVAADMYSVAQSASHEEFSQAAGLLVHSVAQNFLDEGYASGIADLLRAVDDSDRYGESYIRNFISTAAVPYSVGMTQLAKSVDPYARQARTVTDAMLAKIPFASETLMPRRDIWGEPVPNNEFRGVYASQIRSDPVDQELLSLGHYPAFPERKIRGVPLTDKQYDDYSRIAGRLAKTRLNTMVTQPGFNTLPAVTRWEMISKTVSGTRNTARNLVMMQNPQIIQRAVASKLSRVVH